MTELANYRSDSIYERLNQIAVDAHGIDPLRDTSFDFLLDVEPMATHIVTQGQRARPDLISHLHYRTTDLWWVILIYNSVFFAHEIFEGMSLQIPNISSVSDRLNVSKTAKLVTSSVKI